LFKSIQILFQNKKKVLDSEEPSTKDFISQGVGRETKYTVNYYHKMDNNIQLALAVNSEDIAPHNGPDLDIK